MKNKIFIQLWSAFKIWIIAVAINTLVGSLYLTGFNITNGIKEYILIGFAFSLIFSFPIFLILFIIINRCVRNKTRPGKIFEYIFCTGIVLTVIVSWLFDHLLDITEIVFPLFFCALLSGMISIGSQYKSIMRMIPRTETMIENFLK